MAMGPGPQPLVKGVGVVAAITRVAPGTPRQPHDRTRPRRGAVVLASGPELKMAQPEAPTEARSAARQVAPSATGAQRSAACP